MSYKVPVTHMQPVQGLPLPNCGPDRLQQPQKGFTRFGKWMEIKECKHNEAALSAVCYT